MDVFENERPSHSINVVARKKETLRNGPLNCDTDMSTVSSAIKPGTNGTGNSSKKTIWSVVIMNSFLLSSLIMAISTIWYVDSSLVLSGRTMVADDTHRMLLNEFEPVGTVKLSLVILTYKKRKKLRDLLLSITHQRTNFKYEIIVVDNGCLPGLLNEINHILLGSSWSPSIQQQHQRNRNHNFKYLQLCDNPGYSVGNNRGYQQADPTSQYALFLNDDLVLRDGYFLQSMVDLFEIQSATAGAVGCKLLNEKGNKVLEAGSIAWRDGSTMGYGRGRTDIDAHDLQYSRPVDYVSGACLMVAMPILNAIGGFDANEYPAYYEDTDLQMKIQHQFKKYVWYQPRAVALHMEHGSFGSHSLSLMKNSYAIFKRRWQDSLLKKHIYPGPLTENAEFQSFRASDVRGRVTTLDKPNVLVLSEYIPCKFNGAGRSWDNLITLNNMGLRVTLFATNADVHMWSPTTGCGKVGLQQAGIEVIQGKDALTLQTLLSERPFYYNTIVIAGDPDLFKTVNKTLHDNKLFDNAAIIYDAAYIRFRRDEKVLRIVADSNSLSISLPPGLEEYRENYKERLQNFENDRQYEVSIFKSVDIVVTVSDPERDAVIDLLSNDKKESNLRKKVEGSLLSLELNRKHEGSALEQVDTVATMSEPEMNMVLDAKGDNKQRSDGDKKFLGNLRNDEQSRTYVPTSLHRVVSVPGKERDAFSDLFSDEKQGSDIRKDIKENLHNIVNPDETSALESVHNVTTIQSPERDTVLDLLHVDRRTPDVNNAAADVSHRVIRIGHHTHNTHRSRPYEPYHTRSGILFVGSFVNNDHLDATNSKMFNNGDAIWHFLQEIYPKILTANSSSTSRISLTIVGREIPQQLYDYAESNKLFENLITFVESPQSISQYYDAARVFISPQLYGSGIPYKVSEAMAAGVPTIISGDTAEMFGSEISMAACEGSSVESFKDCVLLIHNDPDVWLEYHMSGLAYIRRTHLLSPLKKLWKNAIDGAIGGKTNRGASIVLLDGLPTEGPESTACLQLDHTYMERYPEVKELVANSAYKSGLDHFYNTDHRKGYVYDAESEKLYLANYPDVREAVDSVVFKSGWDHFIQVGQHSTDYLYSPLAERQYREREFDVDQSVKLGAFPNAWTHFINHGKAENRVYGCW